MPLGLSAAALARWHRTQQLRSLPAATQLSNGCSIAAAARPCPKLSCFRSQSFSPTSTLRRQKARKKFKISPPLRKVCCFSFAKSHAADQGSGSLARTMSPYASRQQGTGTCGYRPPGNRRQSPPAPWHRARISPPSRARVGRREPLPAGALKGTEPEPRTGARGDTVKVLRGDKADGRNAQLT